MQDENCNMRVEKGGRKSSQILPRDFFLYEGTVTGEKKNLKLRELFLLPVNVYPIFEKWCGMTTCGIYTKSPCEKRQS